MKRIQVIIVLFFLIIFIDAMNGIASTDFNIFPNTTALGPVITFADIDETEQDIAHHPNNFFSQNDEAIPYGMAMANTAGYPNGKSIIKPLPHFEAGLAFGGSMYQLDRKSDNFSKENTKVPGGGANGSIHFGTGINERFDITGKLLFSKNFYSPDKDYSKETSDSAAGTAREYKFALDSIDFLSIGGKLRYNLVKEKVFLPGIFSFGGVTTSAALDYLYGKVSASGSFFDRRIVTFDVSDGTETIKCYTPVETSVEGNTSATWSILSVTPEALAYVDLFYVFSFYAGPSVSLNTGNVTVKSIYRGKLVNKAPISGATIDPLVENNTEIADSVLTIEEKMKVPWAIPKFTTGLELNLLVFKIQVEGSIVLTDPNPMNTLAAQAGFRVQI